MVSGRQAFPIGTVTESGNMLNFGGVPHQPEWSVILWHVFPQKSSWNSTLFLRWKIELRPNDRLPARIRPSCLAALGSYQPLQYSATFQFHANTNDANMGLKSLICKSVCKQSSRDTIYKGISNFQDYIHEKIPKIPWESWPKTLTLLSTHPPAPARSGAEVQKNDSLCTSHAEATRRTYRWMDLFQRKIHPPCTMAAFIIN